MMAIIISDSFERPDAPTLGVADTGQTWQIHNTSGTATYNISANRAGMSQQGTHGSRNFAYIDAGVSDFEYEIRFSTIERGGMVFRGKNQSNPVEFIRLRGVGTYYELAHYRGATANNSVPAMTNVYGTISTAPANGDVVKVIANGANIKVFLNGTLQLDVEVPVLLNETLVGINGGFNGQNLNYFDEVLVSTLASAEAPRVKIGEVRIPGAFIPVYNIAGHETQPFRYSIGGTTGFIPLVEVASPNASAIRIATTYGVRAWEK